MENKRTFVIQQLLRNSIDISSLTFLKNFPTRRKLLRYRNIEMNRSITLKHNDQEVIQLKHLDILLDDKHRDQIPEHWTNFLIRISITKWLFFGGKINKGKFTLTSETFANISRFIVEFLDTDSPIAIHFWWPANLALKRFLLAKKKIVVSETYITILTHFKSNYFRMRTLCCKVTNFSSNSILITVIMHRI